jgi:leader peptidase (prepilin peptidase)/N-methyltransferase
VLVSLFYGSLLGSFVGIAMMLFRGKDRKYPIPFGPFLCLGFAVYALFGPTAIDAPIALFLGRP